MCAICAVEEHNFKSTVRAVKLYHKGLTITEISDALNYDPLTVAYWIEEYA